MLVYVSRHADRLLVQLAMLDSKTGKYSRWKTSLQSLRQAQPVLRSAFNQAKQLVWLLLTVLCSNAEAECNFLSLRRLETFAVLREARTAKPPGSSSRSQKQTGGLDIDPTASEFVAKSDSRYTTFGCIGNCDCGP